MVAVAELRPVIVHYHLHPGGVTSVIRDGLLALARYGGYKKIRAKIVVGSLAHADSFRDHLLRASSKNLSIDFEYLPSLGYHSRGWPSQREFESDSRTLIAQLERICQAHHANLLWAHNPTVGKNPLVTAALNDVALRLKGLRVLFHIHDFAECGRFENLRALRNCHPSGGLEEWYPVSSSLTLITLTESDRRRLVAAGYPETNVRTLWNPVDSGKVDSPFTPQDRKSVV